MYRILFILLILLCSGSLAAQNAACNGLNNPDNFSLYTSPVSGRYSGAVGTVLSQTSSCNSLGMNFSTTYNASQLATATGSSSCYFTQSSDYQNHYVIKSAGSDALTLNNLPFLPPQDTSIHKSIRVGNHCGGTQANALYYDFQVSAENALVYIYYAISLENSLHAAEYNPEFVIRVLRNVNGTYQLVGEELCYIVQSPTSSTNLGDFLAAGSQNIYKPWAKVAINLYNLLYQQVRIEVATGDCAYTQHYGYAYIAGDCSPMRLVANGCAAGESDEVATIAAPPGLNNYVWYKSRTGVTTSTDLSDFVQIPDADQSTLLVRAEDFILDNGTTATQNTFLCRMTSYMNPNIPVHSVLTTDVGNKKPTIAIDSVLYCDGTVNLTDQSFTQFVENENIDRVDTAHTRWRFFATNPVDPVYTAYGSTASYTFPTPGMHTVKVRVSAFDSTCWNEKTIRVRSLTNPNPHYSIPRNNLCQGDQIILIDDTPGTVSWRQWIVHHANGTSDTTSVTGGGFNYTYDSTEVVELRVRNNHSFRIDTNADGILDRVYCEASFFDTIHVQKFPTLQVTGDTIVCMGTQAVVNVSADVPGCTYEWYHSLFGSTPFQSGVTLSDSPQSDMRYFVKAISPNGCESWDSIRIYIVEPVLKAPVTEICKDETVHLYGSNAFSYTWSSMPADPSLVGQESNEEIIVTPAQTTTYTLTGHGMNNCNANPLTATIRVFPYPIPAFEQTPGFVDSENPVVIFRDVSPNSTTSLWNFGGGNTSTDRRVRHTFTDLTQDSILLSLTTGNELGCTADTNWWIPVELFAVWFPNAITPTLGTNRTFKPFTNNKLEFYTLYIFNRGGDLVFYSKDQTEEWDGTYKGRFCDQGVYVYQCSYRRPGTSDIVTQRGTVTLIQ